MLSLHFLTLLLLLLQFFPHSYFQNGVRDWRSHRPAVFKISRTAITPNTENTKMAMGPRATLGFDIGEIQAQLPHSVEGRHHPHCSACLGVRWLCPSHFYQGSGKNVAGTLHPFLDVRSTGRGTGMVRGKMAFCSEHMEFEVLLRHQSEQA